jgi:hypothetical protein
MQGISRNRALFHENLSRKRLQIQQLEGQIPYAADVQGIYLREQGIVSAFWTGAGNFARNRSVRPDGRRGRWIRWGGGFGRLARSRSTRAKRQAVSSGALGGAGRIHRRPGEGFAGPLQGGSDRGTGSRARGGVEQEPHDNVGLFVNSALGNIGAQ